MAKKKSAGKPATPAPKSGAADKKKPSAPPWLKSGGPSAAKPSPPSPKPKSGSKPLQMSPIARRLLGNARKRSPLDAASARKISRGEVDAIRQLAVALAENEIGLGTDEDKVLICNRASEPSPIPITELLYDTCRWCEADIYYDRLMPSPPGMVRVCIPCGIMLLDADQKGRN